MKKILTLIMLCTSLGFFMFSCNNVEGTTNKGSTETQTQETNNAEKIENESSKSEQLYISLVKDNKIVIPNKTVKEIRCQKNYRDSGQSYGEYTIGDELIFRTPEKIAEIVEFFQDAQVSESVRLPTGNLGLTISFYYTDNTHIVFNLLGEGITYYPKKDDINFEKFYFSKYDEVQSVFCCSTTFQ